MRDLYLGITFLTETCGYGVSEERRAIMNTSHTELLQLQARGLVPKDGEIDA